MLWLASSQITPPLILCLFHLTCSPGSMCPGKNLVSQCEAFRWNPPKQILVCKKNPKLMDRCQVGICQSDNDWIDFMILSLEVPRCGRCLWASIWCSHGLLDIFKKIWAKIRESYLYSACKWLVEMGKNDEIVPVFILRVLYLANRGAGNLP